MCVDEDGLIFYLVYEFERLRLLPGLDRSISNNCSSSNRTNNARAGFAPDELLGSGTTQPRPCIISSNTFATDKGRCDRSLARSAWDSALPKNRPVGYGMIRAGVRTDSMIGVRKFRTIQKGIKPLYS